MSFDKAGYRSKNRHMRKLAFIMMALIPALIYAVSPVSGKIGPVAVGIKEGSITETALAAVSEPFTEAWLEKYTPDPMKSGEILSPVLSSALPLSNPIAGEEKAGAVDILDLATGSVYSFIFRDGRIASCYPSYASQSPEL